MHTSDLRLEKRQDRRQNGADKLTSWVPKLSLGLIQYKNTRPIVAYLFCGGRIDEKLFGPPG